MRRVSARLTESTYRALEARAGPGKRSGELTRAIEIYVALMRVLEENPQ